MKVDISSTSSTCCGFFWLGWEICWLQLCGSLIGSKQDVQRFCISSVVGKTSACSVATHAKCAKAKAEPLAWYITSALCGKLGGRAALVDKWYFAVQFYLPSHHINILPKLFTNSGAATLSLSTI
jgi:hypothetical protein